MKTIYSPNNIDVLLHFAISTEPHPRRHAPSVNEAINELLFAGALVPATGEPERFAATPLGLAWVQALCNVPPPRAAFIDEMGRVIK